MTKLLMLGSGWVMAATGLILTFAPQETANAMGYPGAGAVILVLQLLGALYLGFSIVNWMGKGNLIGGVFGKPVAIGNFAHFLIAGLALLKAAWRGGTGVLWAIAIIYIVFAAGFAILAFGGPYYKPRQ